MSHLLRHSARSAARRTLLAGVERLTRRTAVLLPAEAGLVDLLDARAPYRIASNEIRYDIHPPAPGLLTMRVLGHVSLGMAPVLWQSEPMTVAGPSELTLSLQSRTLRAGGIVLARLPMNALPKRFTTEFVCAAGGREWTRRLGHYIVQAASDEDYFSGGHYRDYEAQAKGDAARTVATLRERGAKSPLLEIGCATGLLLAACADDGMDVMGVDASAWAVERARQRLSPSQVLVADVSAGLPRELCSRVFETVVMNAVLEHVEDPEALLASIARVVAPGGLLFLTTANANSLTHWLFGADWEGFADPTHKSAHRITPDNVTAWLIGSGWQVEHLTTHSVWDDNPDPVHATLRDVAAADARFRQLLTQYQRGDFLDCIARRSER